MDRVGFRNLGECSGIDGLPQAADILDRAESPATAEVEFWNLVVFGKSEGARTGQAEEILARQALHHPMSLVPLSRRDSAARTIYCLVLSKRPVTPFLYEQIVPGFVRLFVAAVAALFLLVVEQPV